MSLQIAYWSVILIWSTTPLAIQWSAQGAGYAFAVLARMVIGSIVCLFLLRAARIPFPLHRKALLTYGAAGIGIFGAMFSTYWGSRYIESGLIAVLFGLSPIVTGLAAAVWLEERSLSPMKLVGMISGLAGLMVIFGGHFRAGSFGWAGIAAVLFAVVIQSASMVWVKRIAADAHAIAITAGALMVSLPLFAFSWWLVDGQWPAHLISRAGAAILYLGIFGSVMGFILYFHIVKHMETGRVALITLLTPVSALMLGHALNNEEIPAAVWLGTAMILGGLSLHQWQSLGGLIYARTNRGREEQPAQSSQRTR
jgi:drug/metabolite transporter (DMT)-like permease